MKRWLNLENFIYLTIFLLPSYLIKLNILGLSTNALEILIVVALAWAILKRSFGNFLKLRFRITIGIILAGLVASTLVNGNYLVGAGIIKSWFILPLLLAVIAKNVVPQEKINNIYRALYCSGFMVAGGSLAYYFFCGAVETRQCLVSTYDGRLEGIFNSPNYLAMYLAPALIVGWMFQKELKQKKFWYVFWYVISYVTIATAFFLTYSYAAWMAVISSLAVIEIIKKHATLKSCNFLRTLKFTFFVKSVLFVGLIGLIILSQWNNQKFVDLRHASERSSASSRLMIWRATEKITADNLIFGIGAGNFQNKYLEYQKYFPPYLEWAVPHPHNLYLAVWLSAGVIGLFGFLALLHLWFKEIAEKEKDLLWRISLGIMIYILLHGLVDTTYFKNDLACIFWLNFVVLL